MNLNEARKIIEVQLADNWSYTPIKWQNVENRNLSIPAQQVLEFGTDDYLAVDVDIFSSLTITVPASCIRYSGEIITSLCVKEGKGAAILDQYATFLINILENKTLPGDSDPVRVRNITGSALYRAAPGWYVRETRFSFFFNRFVSSP